MKKELSLKELYEILGLEEYTAPTALVKLNSMCLKSVGTGTCPLEGDKPCDCFIQRAVNRIVGETGINPRRFNFELQVPLKGGETVA